MLPYIIHDNGASIKGKGISFTRKRLERHLKRYTAEYGNEGYILLLDFSKFFDNIRHDKLLERIKEHIADPWLIQFIANILKTYRIDVSYTDDENIMNEIFNALEYEKIDKSKLIGKRWMGKSLGIGSPISQIAGIYYPGRIDTYIKTVCGMKYYGVYMDDRYVIHRDKRVLQELVHRVKDISEDMGLHLNMHKTQIVKLSHGFTFLKTKYIVTDSGKIIKRLPRDTIVRERRKLKRLAKLASEGKLEYSLFKQQYFSWRGDKCKYKSYRTVKEMDNLFRRLKQWIRKNRKQSEKKNSR